RQNLMTIFPVSFEEGYFDSDHASVEELQQMAADKIAEAFDHKFQAEVEKAKNSGHTGSQLGFSWTDVAQHALRGIMAQKVDQLWQEHLLTMDHLRSEVSLRTVAQKDPLIEFKHEAFRLFHDLTHNLHLETARNLFKFEIRAFHPNLFQDMLNQMQLETNR